MEGGRAVEGRVRGLGTLENPLIGSSQDGRHKSDPRTLKTSVSRVHGCRTDEPPRLPLTPWSSFMGLSAHVSESFQVGLEYVVHLEQPLSLLLLFRHQCQLFVRVGAPEPPPVPKEVQ